MLFCFSLQCIYFMTHSLRFAMLQKYHLSADYNGHRGMLARMVQRNTGLQCIAVGVVKRSLEYRLTGEGRGRKDGWEQNMAAPYRRRRQKVTRAPGKGANVNMQGGRYGRAFRGGCEFILQLLHKKGADVVRQCAAGGIVRTSRCDCPTADGEGNRDGHSGCTAGVIFGMSR